MSEFTKYPLSKQLPEQPNPEAVDPSPYRNDLSMDDIAFHVQRGKQLHSKAIRGALFAGFCSVGKAADRAVTAIGHVFRKEGHSPS